jgi:sugar (pentulose or hexulose) kinase
MFKKITKYTFVGDYITKKLCGHHVIDPTSASITMLFNIKKGIWDEEILNIVGISEDQLPTISNSGEPVGLVKNLLKKEFVFLNPNVLVSNGGHDQYCASIGCGALKEGDLMISGGTAWVLLLTLNNFVIDRKRFFSPGRHVLKNKWGLLSSIPSAGASINWFKNVFCSFINNKDISERNFFNAIERDTYNIPAGSKGIKFYPYFVSSSNFNSIEGASIFGINLFHKPAHFFKALMEGIGFEVMRNDKNLKKLGVKIKSVSMIGGATKSLVWPQMISDMLNVSLKLPKIKEAAAVGASILAGVGDNIFSDCSDGFKSFNFDMKNMLPREKTSAKYARLFSSYEQYNQKIYQKS